MTKNEIFQTIAAILTALAETNGAPESMLYIGLGMDIHKWTDIRGLMIDSELITISGHYVTLTDKGRSIADKCNQVLASSK